MQALWSWKIPLPTRKPFREAKLRIDAVQSPRFPEPQLITLLAEAMEVQNLVLASPEMSINQLANKLGRCRKQMIKLLRASWLSPRIVDAILSGSHPKAMTRARLLEADLPVDWARQEALLGFAA